jgi:hypothetical protein
MRRREDDEGGEKRREKKEEEGSPFNQARRWPRGREEEAGAVLVGRKQCLVVTFRQNYRKDHWEAAECAGGEELMPTLSRHVHF